MDPTPLHHRNLDADAEEFLENWALEFPQNSHFRKKVYTLVFGPLCVGQCRSSNMSGGPLSEREKIYQICAESFGVQPGDG
jgi:hypothetical protein